MPRAISTVAFGYVLLTALACSSPERDLGRTRDAPPPDAMRMSECEDTAQEGKLRAPRAMFLSEFVGRWIGDAEDALGDMSPDAVLPVYTFPSGSTRILLEVSQPDDELMAKLTFGGALPAPPTDAERSAPTPTEGLAYSAEPIASALDLERSGEDEASGKQLALDGKLVLTFSVDDAFASELHVRIGGDGLVGVFDGLSLLNERGFLTRPGSVRFRPLAGATRRSD